MAKNITQVAELLKKALALLGGDASEDSAAEAPSIPSVKKINTLEPEELAELASSLGINAKKPKLLLILASQIVSGEADDASEDELAALCKATGVSEGEDEQETLANLKEFLTGGAAEGDDEDEKPAKKGKKAAAEADDEDEDEKPVRKAKKAASDDEDDEDEKPAKKGKKVEADDEDEDEKPVKKGKKVEAEDDEDDDAEPPKAAKWLAQYNKVAKKPLKNWAALKAALTDDDGNVAKWGAAYVKDELAHCCGLKCKDVEHEGEEVAKCVVTGKLFKPTDEGTLEEVEVE